MTQLKVGVFDLVERGDGTIADIYERRLELVERYEQAGFYSYHLAEHHATPHGLAPAPSVLLSALAQRTQRLRFGPLVYLLPFYHPLRLLEEICMLDQLSRGRLDVGFGRGVSPLERAVYDIPPADSDRLYNETYQVLRAGLETDTLNFTGDFHRFENIPISVRPYQQPRPPLWYGTSSLESVDWVAREGVNLVTSQDIAFARRQAARYWQLRNPAPSDGQPATVGLLRKIIVAETDAQANALANRIYPQWLSDFNFHHHRAGITVRESGDRPPTWEQFAHDGRGVAGTPETVLAALAEQLSEPAFNYLVAEFYFGPMTVAEAVRSIDLFVQHVMPALGAPQVGTDVLNTTFPGGRR